MMLKVESSNIDAIGYDPDLKRLSVRFKSGRTYQYENVGEDDYQNLLNASSTGKHFNDHIKNNFRVRG
jgi:hypothetical protein